MSPIRKLLTEAHRRGLLRVLGIFVGGGWGVLQVLDLFIERGFVPEWVFEGALLALVLGLPVVLTTAFVQGGRRAAEAAEGERAEPSDAEHGLDVADFFTWNRAILGGVLSFALLGVAASGYMVMRVTGIGAPATLAAQGVFEVGSRVVLADFESSAGDVAPGDLVTEALRIDLEQSTALTLVESSEISSTLERMLRESGESMTEEVALEVAIRTGAAAVISGEIGRLGAAFVLTARILEAESGDGLASFRVTASDADDLIGAIDDLSAKVRSKVGESLRSVATTEPLTRVTTTSLEALRKHTAAVHNVGRGAISPSTAQQLLLDAVRLDSTFAAAYRPLSVIIRNYGGDRELAQTAAEAAFRHRERLPERERLIVEASYHTFSSGDEGRAIRAYRALLALDSTDATAAGNLSDALMYAGQYEESVRVLHRTPNWENQPYTWNLTTSLVALNRLDEVLAARDTAETAQPNNPYSAATRTLALAMSGEVEAARTAIEGSPEASDPGDLWRSYVRGVIHVLSGELRSWDRGAQLRDAIYVDAQDSSGRLHYGLAGPWVTAWVRGDPTRAARELEAHLARMDLPSLSPFNRNYPQIGLTYAMLADETAAREMLDLYHVEAASIADPASRSRVQIAEALLSVQARGAAGLVDLEAAVRSDRCARCRDFYLGHGYELTDRTEQAIDAYERYLAFPFYDGDTYVTHLFTSAVHERLGRLYEEAGNAEQASEHYLRFAELWANADPDLQPRVRQAAERAAALQPPARRTN